MTIKLENEHLIVKEAYKNSRGGKYTYIARGSKLIHISRVFRPSKKEDKRTEYSIPLSDIDKILGEEIKLVEFYFSNKGYFNFTVYRMDTQAKTLDQEFPESKEITERYEFEILGGEYQALNEYERKVPPLIKRVWEIEKKLNLILNIRGARGEEVHENPELAKFNSLVFPNPKSRIRSLKEKIRFTHELYVLMLVIDSVLTEPPEGRRLMITHEEEPTLVIKGKSPLTIWYQFSIKDWFEVVKRGVIALFEGTRIKRSHVKPDIMIFKGEYHFRSDLSENPPDKAVLIDAKVEMTQSDLKQLLEYRTKFPETFENIEFIVAAIDKMPANYKHKLEREGYRVIEQVFPNKPGENEFQEAIRDIIETWKE